MQSGYVYIIYSEAWDQYYVGSTADPEHRLEQHHNGRNKSTRGGAPWVIQYLKKFERLKEARQLEYQVKRKKSRKYLEWLISSGD